MWRRKRGGEGEEASVKRREARTRRCWVSPLLLLLLLLLLLPRLSLPSPLLLRRRSPKTRRTPNSCPLRRPCSQRC